VFSLIQTTIIPVLILGEPTCRKSSFASHHPGVKAGFYFQTIQMKGGEPLNQLTGELLESTLSLGGERARERVDSAIGEELSGWGD
jgi:hypothetical protein